MSSIATELSQRLARDAEAVCREYLSNGRRSGRYWLVGDVGNSPGRSLFVRLSGPASGKAAAGKWTDAATGEHGDLLDLIAVRCGHRTLGDTLDEARRFLSLPTPRTRPENCDVNRCRPARREAARRLWAMAQPIRGTVAQTYLHARGIADVRHGTALRFHPRCYYRGDDDDAEDVPTAWPALIAAVTDLDGAITGVHRTWLDLSGRSKAPAAAPRRAMGQLNGNGVRFGTVDDTMIAGEGIETMLSLRSVMSDLPMVAALSANHLAALILPARLRRLYIARDDDAAGAPRGGVVDRARARRRDGGADARPSTRRLQRRPPPAWTCSARRRGAGAARSGRSYTVPEAAAWPRRRNRGGAAARVIVTDRPWLRGPRPRPSERADRTGGGPGRQRLRATIFPCAGARAFLAKQNSRASAVLRCAAAARTRAASRRCRPGPPPVFGAREGRDGRGRQPGADAMTTDDEPTPTESPAAALLAELQLYGHRPFQDDPDARPLPEDRIVRGALADIFDALVATLPRDAPRTRPRGNCSGARSTCSTAP